MRTILLTSAVLCTLIGGTPVLADASAPPSSAPAAGAPPPAAGKPDVATLAAHARKLFALREDPQQFAPTMKALEAWMAAAPNDAEPHILFSRATYWFVFMLERGGDKEARKALLFRGLEVGRRAATLAPADPGGDFWAVTNLGVYGRMVGVTKSASSLGEIRERLTRIEKRDNRYFYGGVWRFQGRLIDQVPGALRMMYGYDLDDALAHYRKAASIEPRYLQTWIFMAECLLQKGDDAEAYRVLTRTAAADPTLLPEVLPENRLFHRRAAALLKEHFPKGAP